MFCMYLSMLDVISSFKIWITGISLMSLNKIQHRPMSMLLSCELIVCEQSHCMQFEKNEHLWTMV